MQDVTPVILTFNEAANIDRTLESVQWAREVVVIDSFSTDDTVSRASQFPNVRILQRLFDDHTSQWNFALDNVKSSWVLTLDADYVINCQLADEIQSLSPIYTAYFASFEYYSFGKPLRSTLYPPRCVLFKTEDFRYVKDGHTQQLNLNQVETGKLQFPIAHDDRKPLSDWLSSQRKYAKLEAEKLLSKTNLSWKDRIRKYFILAPILTFAYCLFFKLLILDGRRGLHYSVQRTYAELLLGLELLDSNIRKHG